MTDLERAARIVAASEAVHGYVSREACHGLTAEIAAAMSAVRGESEKEIAALLVTLKRADGALADAATVPTSDGITWNVEPGIRALTAERDALRVAPSVHTTTDPSASAATRGAA